MMAGSTSALQSEAGYIDARPQIRQIDENLLRRTAGTCPPDDRLPGRSARAQEERGMSSSIIEKFRAKYGANDVKKYYSKLDVAVLARAR